MKKIFIIWVLLIMSSCSESKKQEIKQDTLIVNDTCKVDSVKNDTL